VSGGQSVNLLCGGRDFDIVMAGSEWFSFVKTGHSLLREYGSGLTVGKTTLPGTL
jgi:hypothetical protein